MPQFSQLQNWKSYFPSILLPDVDEEYFINCHFYVFLFRECLGEAHEPCDCQTWKNWLQKITEMKPEERKMNF